MTRNSVWLLLAPVILFGCANPDGGVNIPVQTAEAEPVEVGEPFEVLFETTKGSFTVQVNPEWSPRGAAHFRELVEDGFYTDCAFFRAIEGFMVQFGIAGDPEMNTKWKDTIKDDPVVKSNARGYLTYAKTGMPNSRSTQLFINLGNNARLDRDGFAPIGIVTGNGMEIVDKINTEYGDQQMVSQGAIEKYGNSALVQALPNLDYIKKATIVEKK